MDSFPLVDATKKFFGKERKRSDALPHRTKDLEVAVLNLQLETYVDRIHAILDEHRSSLPPLEEQNDDIRSWRLSLDRMDLRRYRESTKANDPSAVSTTESEPDEQRVAVFVEMEPPDRDIQEMVDRTNEAYSEFNRDISLLMWGMGIFERNNKTSARPDEWREKLKIALQIVGGIEETIGGIDKSSSAKAYVAAVCIRDHWVELTPDEQEWCLALTCDVINARCDETDQIASIQRYSMSGDRPAAFVVSALCVAQIPDSQKQRALRALAQALTHGIDEVGEYAAIGASEHLWGDASALASRCVNALAYQSELLQEQYDAERQKNFRERRPISTLKAHSVATIRRMIEGSDSVDDESYARFKSKGWIGSHTLVKVLSIAKTASTEQIAVNLFRRASETLQSWWTAGRKRRGRDDDHDDQRPHHIEPTIQTLLERFVLLVEPADAQIILTPILEEIDRNPREVSWIVRGLICAEDSLFRPANFWAIWDQFASRIPNSNLLTHIDDARYDTGDEIIAAIFLASGWKDNVRHWRSLEGFAGRVHKLFLALPPSATILDDYVRFLYHIGEQSLPAAFEHIADRLNCDEPKQVLSKDNTVFMLESLLRRHVYGRPLETKRERRIRKAVLFVLDKLVEAGSSAAYRMRDDFVTPVPLAT